MISDLKSQIHGYLVTRCLGRQYAIKARDLAGKFNINLREVNEIIRQLRKDGRLIGSAKEQPFGYYVPANDHERAEYLKAFKGELFDMLETFRAQRKARQNFLERQSQPELFTETVSGQMELVGI